MGEAIAIQGSREAEKAARGSPRKKIRDEGKDTYLGRRHRNSLSTESRGSLSTNFSLNLANDPMIIGPGVRPNRFL